MDNWKTPWLRSTLSENDGTGSMARLAILVVIFASVALLFYLAVARETLFLAAITLITAFDVAVIGALYGINKVAQTMQLGIEAKKDGAQ